ncbi:uncharacterized protein LOC143043183 [Mytilus galloprovincialis]|uniref:uncharacterized protein LOC143043183 n=1 Tax=Mytilus galloprovincialis TaxID=29158 RepID=UPI003F7CCA2E
MLNHAKLVSTELRERNKGLVPIHFKRPGDTASIPEIEEVISTFESRMQDVFNVINERDAEIKYLKSGNSTGGVQSAGIQDYRQRLEEKNKELNTLKIQLTEAQKGQSKNKGNEFEKQQIQELRERKNSLEKNFDLARKQIEDRSKEIEKLKRCLDQFDEESSKTKKELKAKIKDNEDLRTRLSQVAGAKLVAGNTSIADLGDKFRPTRIAELYSELYDNDWTEAVDNFSKQEWPEEVIVQHLFITLQGCYIACSQLANQQLQDLVQKLSLDTSSQDGITKFRESHTTEIRQLVDARKGTARDVANSISKNLYKNQKFDEVLRSYKWMKDDIVRQITKLTFFEKCVTVCWLMVVQDPEMYIADNLRPGMKFNKEHYREYTKSGPKVDYSVWPALYLHKNGPLMIKGVAQACD